MKRQTGFTLIELIMVIVILGILAATALPKFVDLKSEANQAAVSGVAGALSSASAINVAGCSIAPTDTAKCTSLPVGAGTTCSDIGGLLNPPITITAGALPNPTVQGSYYIVTDTALATSGTSCTLVMGNGAQSGVSATYAGHATN